ncbi:hypothetical protein IG631_03456 [Alternaria alternata]|nr:hypothetical protein IG631_03456 [Alternaria alternata]
MRRVECCHCIQSVRCPLGFQVLRMNGMVAPAAPGEGPGVLLPDATTVPFLAAHSAFLRSGPSMARATGKQNHRNSVRRLLIARARCPRAHRKT